MKHVIYSTGYDQTYDDRAITIVKSKYLSHVLQILTVAAVSVADIAFASKDKPHNDSNGLSKVKDIVLPCSSVPSFQGQLPLRMRGSHKPTASAAGKLREGFFFTNSQHTTHAHFSSASWFVSSAYYRRSCTRSRCHRQKTHFLNFVRTRCFRGCRPAIDPATC